MNALLQFAQSQYKIAKLQLESAEKLLKEAEEQSLEIDQTDQWVYIKKLSARLGLSTNAIYSRKRNEWIEGIHWKRERPGKRSNLLFNTVEIQKWLQNTQVSNSIMENLESGSCGKENKPSNLSILNQHRQTTPQPPDCVKKFLTK